MKKISESYKLIVFAALARKHLVGPAKPDVGIFTHYIGWSFSLHL